MQGHGDSPGGADGVGKEERRPRCPALGSRGEKPMKRPELGFGGSNSAYNLEKGPQPTYRA